METTNWRPSKNSVPPPRGLHRFGVRFATLGALSLFACSSSSGPNWPSGAFLFTNPSSFTYVADGGGSVVPSLAAYLTTTQSFAIEIQDHGSDPLTIDKVTLDDPQHGFALVPPSPAGPDGGQLLTLNPWPEQPSDAFVKFTFTPTSVGPYSASITITSNAALDGGAVTIPITALGVSPDAGQFNGDGG